MLALALAVSAMGISSCDWFDDIAICDWADRYIMYLLVEIAKEKIDW